jgi:hypothetical protein
MYLHGLICRTTEKGLKRIFEYDDVKQIASDASATPVQVLIAWGTKRGFSVIPKSVHKGMCPRCSAPPTCLVANAYNEQSVLSPTSSRWSSRTSYSRGCRQSDITIVSASTSRTFIHRFGTSTSSMRTWRRRRSTRSRSYRRQVCQL